MEKIERLTRIQKEYDDLTEKIDRLKKFMESDEFNELNFMHQMILRQQFISMNGYKLSLGQRITLLNFEVSQSTEDSAGETDVDDFDETEESEAVTKKDSEKLSEAKKARIKEMMLKLRSKSKK